MKIDEVIVKELREQRFWSQEELSLASGLNIRTIQRIENEGTASLQSKKALAAAFEIDINQLDYKETPQMKRFEYQSVVLKFDIGWSKKNSVGPFDFDYELNKYGNEGWELKHLTVGTTVHGGSGQAIAVLQRELLR